ncbi:hypothetical protein Q8A73_014424 [Channa argus]|nr:hypothetical protein Q8A73_014424 [Channa argus]
MLRPSSCPRGLSQQLSPSSSSSSSRDVARASPLSAALLFFSLFFLLQSPAQLTEFVHIGISPRCCKKPALIQAHGPPTPTPHHHRGNSANQRQVTARSGIFISTVVVFHPSTPSDSRQPELPPLCPLIRSGLFSASRSRRLPGILPPHPRADADVLELGLHGPGGAAVATSELDPLPVSDLSAASVLLAPLTVRTSSLHPRPHVCQPVRPSVHGLAVTLERGGQKRGKSRVSEEMTAKKAGFVHPPPPPVMEN